MNWIEVEERLPILPRRVAEEFKVQARKRNFRDGSTQVGTRCLKRRKKGQRESSSANAFVARNHTRGRKKEGKKGRKENGWHRRYGLPASPSSDPSRAPNVHHHRDVG